MRTVVVVLLLILPFVGLLRAGDDHDHGHSHADIKVPPTLAGLREEVAVRQKSLTAALAARDARSAHAATDVLVACMRALPGHLQAADEATRQRVTGMANNAAKAWGQAAHAADHGDFTKAETRATQAAAAYRLLEARLPKE